MDQLLRQYLLAVAPLAGCTLLVPPLSPPLPLFSLPIAKGTLLQHLAFSHTAWHARRWWVAVTYSLVHRTAEQQHANIIALLLCGISPFAVLGPWHFYGCYFLGAFAGVIEHVLQEQGLLDRFLGRFLEWGAVPHIVGADAAIQALVGVQTCVLVERVYDALYYGVTPGTNLLYDVAMLCTIGMHVPEVTFERKGLLYGYLTGICYYILRTRRDRAIWRAVLRGVKQLVRWITGPPQDEYRRYPPGSVQDESERRQALATAAEQRHLRRPGR
eukprot:GGOE01002446.1.p1 GENE.GGOE01002446.1~~GGOE01002446.1.p1  ORF type:complete len:280 (+),score=54.41 GGOE01002446.1:26-841(+)